ncbi:hypothetical protein NM208_g14688 [Fusarium decemcellulare]|uniref:Uncharacterized protein n=1 Tax=Fusarium decemcellulare TaxID=57161 RepID=A0ACC1RF79_9HYPO|nr:hypothetical protein NM208_g14688 [Fusarium decemcellulare]
MTERDSKRWERVDDKSFDRERERVELERRKALEVEQQKLEELERQKAQELKRQKTLELERQTTQDLENQKTLELERQLAQQAERQKTREIERQRDLEQEREREYERSKRDSSYALYDDKRDYRKSSRYDDHDDTPRDRKEKDEKKVDVVMAPQKDGGEGAKFLIEHGPEFQVMGEPVAQAEKRKRAVDDEGRELPLPTGAGHQVIAETTQSAQPNPVYDPFQYQVSDDAFTMSHTTTPKRPLTPNVVTIEREPTFDDSPPRTSAADARLSRRDSFEIERMVEEYRNGTRDVSQYQDPRSGHEYEEEEHEAKSILDKAKHATIPVAAAAVAAAVAVEHERSKERRSKDGSSRPRRDAVQEEADRYYRESRIAQKIASDEMRSRSASPERSVIDKWQDDKNEAITIVTPPDMEDKHPEKSPYDGPDADVKIDNKVHPREERKFRNLGDNSRALVLRSREPSRERPVLNLIYPTPAPSRQLTPAPEEKPVVKETDRSTTSEVTSDDYAIGPKGEIIPGEFPPAVSKSVTWGENQTQSYEVVTPENRSDSEATYFQPDSSERSPEKPRPRLSKTSPWGILAAAIAGSSAEPANEPDVEIFADDTSREPPIPGPKPASPHPEQMPGGYADDLEFAATLAAGLKDTGFNPDIVIDDPSYRRRESPPGVQEANGDSHNDAKDGKWYKRASVETVSDTSDASAPKLLPERGFVIGKLDTPQEKTIMPFDAKHDNKKTETRELEKSQSPRAEDVPLPDDGFEFSKLSKREQRKRDKSEVVVVQDDGKAEVVEADPVRPREVGETVWEDTARKRGKKSWKSREFEDDGGPRVPALVEYYEKPSAQDTAARDVRSDDSWDTPPEERQSRSFGAADVAAVAAVAAPAFALGTWSAYNDQPSGDADSREAGHNDQWDSSSRPSRWANREGSEWAASQGSSPSRTYHREEPAKDATSRDVHPDHERDAPEKPQNPFNDDDYYYDDDRSLITGPVRSHHRHSSRDVSSRDVRSDDEREDSKRSRKHRKDLDPYYDDDKLRVSSERRSSRRRSSRDRSSHRSRDHSSHRSRDHSRHRSRDRSRDRSRHRRSDDERDTPRKSKRDSYGYDSPGRSKAASEISVGSSGSRRSKKSKRRSGTEEDFGRYDDRPSDRRREHFDDRDVSSVVSESRGDDRRRESGHRRKTSRYDDDDVKSVASMPGSSRKDKDYKDRRDPEKRSSSGILSSLFKSGRKDKKDSFLDNADTLGAGVGLAGAAAAFASDAARSNAAEAPSEQEHDVSRDGRRRVRSNEMVDPEIRTW